MRNSNGDDHCLMRCGGRIRRLTHLWSVYDERIRRPVGVCDRCGHVQIARLPQPNEYAAVNDRFFAGIFRPTTADMRSSEHDRKSETTLNRLAAAAPPPHGGGRLLDVGAGEGWSHSVAQHFGLDYHVVETGPDLARRLKSDGATIAAGCIQDLLPEWSQNFKVILLRHTLEHLLDPIGDLETLAQSLTSDGILYVALPNFTKGRPKAGFRTDYLRPVHISYFTPNKLAWCLHSAGLRVHSVNDESELWAIAGSGDPPVRLNDERHDNQIRFASFIRANRSKDLRNIRRILGYCLLVRLPSPLQRLVRWGRRMLADS